MIYDEESHPVLLLGLLFQLVNVVIALAITIPLVGALVRYRAHYGPRAVQLGTSEDAPVTTGPVIDGYFVTLRRVHKLEHLILPNFPKSKHEIDAAIIGRLVGFFAIITIGTTVIVPLEIMANRLALQRNHASALPQDGDVVAEELTPYSATEDVIGLRDESDPYLSFVDTAKRMVAEEGCRTMFRAWWITFISLLVTGIVGAWKPGPPPGSLHILGF
ncbi:hypothetical protein H0H81_009755 [Sphagnurus paluster]|uniref:Uncharacterized protein n=1 Tax=Sphagnurus paluster TaxID=117069 RepID=A0A9P7K494_9AGAR|nr:hypothetical protein H0H81_009755 [Sphagnurus paluster]